MNPDHIKHLEFIQAAIQRLAGNSFLLKGWAVTLVAALFALAAKETQHWFAVVSLLPAICFWGLDAYYIRQERLFRRLFFHACEPNSVVPVYCMDPRSYASEVHSWVGTAFSKTVLPFYAPIVIATIVATVMTWPVPTEAGKTATPAAHSAKNVNH